MGEVKLERSDPTFANFTKAHDHENMLLGPLLGLWNVRVQVRTPEASLLGGPVAQWIMCLTTEQKLLRQACLASQ